MSTDSFGILNGISLGDSGILARVEESVQHSIGSILSDVQNVHTGITKKCDD